MKKFSTLMVAVTLFLSAAAQPITGIKTIKAAGGDYSSFSAAITALNLQGVGIGGVTFNVDAGFSITEETDSLNPAGSGIASPIIFQKSGIGPNPVLRPTGNTANNNWGFRISRADYVTFDGIDVNIASGQAVENGYYIDGDAGNGAQYITIKNCAITLNKANTNTTRGIYSTSVASSAPGANNNNKFYNLTIQNVHRGLEITSSSSTFPDLNTEIGILPGGSTQISNLGGTLTFFGVFVNNQADFKVFNVTVQNITTSTTGASYGIRQSGTGCYGRIYNNSILSLTNSSTGTLAGISLAGGKTNTDHMVYGNTVNGITSNGASTGNFVHGIESSISTITLHVYDNSVSGLSTSVNSTLNGALGINISGASVTNYIYRNRFFNIVNNNAGTSTFAGGMNITGTNANVYNNLVYEISAPNSAFATSPGTRGITISGGTTQARLYHNTVYINYTPLSPSGTSAALFAGTTVPSVIELRNNIFVNVSDVTTATRAVAHWRSNATLTSYQTATDNNNYYAGVPSAKNLLFYDGTNSDQTLTSYKNRMGAREQHSISESSPFVSTTPGSVDLHLSTSIATQCENGGLAVSLPINITTDFDNQARGTTYVDIGADEGSFISDDQTGPYINFNPLFNTTLTSSRTLQASIHDPSAVPQSGIGLPVLYWKVNNGSYVAATGTWLSGNTYQFSFGSSVVLNDSVFYYIVAQDSKVTPNPLSNPANNAGGYSVNPPATGTPTSNPQVYKIVLPLASSINVGTAETYTSLTNAGGLFEAIRNNVISSNITVLITSDLTAETGLFDLLPWIEEGVGNYSVTIKPSANVLRIVSGNSSSQPLIRLNGADRVIIDGFADELATDRMLLIRNTGTTLAALSLGGDASNNVITNTILEAQTQVEQMGVIRFLNGAVNGNDSNIISNCLIRNRGDGTYPFTGVASVSSTGSNSYNKLLNNTIINFQGYGYYGTEGNDNWIMSGNDFYHAPGFVSSSPNIIGMSFGATGNNLISNNKFHDLKMTGSPQSISAPIMINNALNTIVERNRIYNVTNAVGTVYGIYFAGSAASNASATLINNQISLNPAGITDQLLIGIADESFNNNTLSSYYNTVYIGGNADPSSGNNSWVYRRSPIQTSVNYLRNNVFFNNRTGTGNHYAMGNLKDAGFSNFKVSNCFYVGRNGSSPADYFNVSATGNANQATSFAGWVSTYKDIESYAMITGDVNPDNLFLGKDTANFSVDSSKIECWYLSGKAMPINGLHGDYNANNVRSTHIINGSCDIGADEFTAQLPPPDIFPTGNHALSGTEDFIFANRKIASITWGSTGVIPDLFAAKHHTGVWPNDTTNNGASSNARFLNEWWDIQAINGSGYSYRLTLYYDSANLGKIQNESTMIMQKKQSGVPGSWITLTPTVVDVLDRSFYRDGLTSFSEFTGSDLLAPIPVKLISFTANKQGADVLLNWIAENESPNTQYILERSSNGTQFLPIHTLNGTGINGNRASYQYLDNRILQYQPVAYYRLQIKENGRVRYSAIIIVRAEKSKDWVLGLWPNPVVAKANILLNIPAKTNIQFRLTDMTGRVVYNETRLAQPGWQTQEMDLSNLAAGVYNLQINNGEANKILRLVKQ